MFRRVLILAGLSILGGMVGCGQKSPPPPPPPMPPAVSNSPSVQDALAKLDAGIQDCKQQYVNPVVLALASQESTPTVSVQASVFNGPLVPGVTPAPRQRVPRQSLLNALQLASGSGKCSDNLSLALLLAKSSTTTDGQQAWPQLQAEIQYRVASAVWNGMQGLPPDVAQQIGQKILTDFQSNATLGSVSSLVSPYINGGTVGTVAIPASAVNGYPYAYYGTTTPATSTTLVSGTTLPTGFVGGSATSTTGAATSPVLTSPTIPGTIQLQLGLHGDSTSRATPAVSALNGATSQRGLNFSRTPASTGTGKAKAGIVLAY